MITYEKLGKNGRLGNQMFQYAMLLGIQEKLGYKIVFNENIDLELFKNFKITECHFYSERDIHAPHEYVEERFEFDRRIYKKISDHTNFFGYFQSEKYFQHCTDVVRKEYTFSDTIQQTAQAFLAPFRQKQLVSLHVRRTDYVNQPNHHPLCTSDYYKEAVNQFDISNTIFVIFSDDIQWCKEHLMLEGMEVVFSENQGTFEDMCIMSLCDHNIIANSTFSWWGAWLNTNPSKKVIAPRVWFGPYYFNLNTKDLYCDTWIQL